MRITSLLALMLFSITAFAQTPTGVIIDGSGTATITWTAPTEYTDGSPLPAADLKGFVIYYSSQSRFEAGGTIRPGCSASPVSGRLDPDCYANSIDLPNGAQVSEPLTIPLDADTTIHFSMTSWVRSGNTFGDWSRYSSEVAKIFTLEVTDGRVPVDPTIESIDLTITCTTNMAMVTCSFNVQ